MEIKCKRCGAPRERIPRNIRRLHFCGTFFGEIHEHVPCQYCCDDRAEMARNEFNFLAYDPDSPWKTRKEKP